MSLLDLFWASYRDDSRMSVGQKMGHGYSGHFMEIQRMSGALWDGFLFFSARVNGIANICIIIFIWFWWRFTMSWFVNFNIIVLWNSRTFYLLDTFFVISFFVVCWKIKKRSLSFIMMQVWISFWNWGIFRLKRQSTCEGSDVSNTS